MGIFTGNKGSIRIALDRPYFYAGDVIAGTVYLTLCKSVECSELRVYLSGMTHVQYERRETNSNNRNSLGHRRSNFNNTVTVRDSMETLCISVGAMQQAKGTELPPGEYCYPFAIQIPADTSSSFALYQGLSHRGGASLHYSVLGVLTCGGLMRSNIKGLVEINIQQVVSMPLPVRPVQESGIYRISKWCCMSDGDLQYDVKLGNSICALNSAAMISIDAAMNSQRDVERIDVILKRKTTFKRGYYHDTTDVCTQQYQGLKAGEPISRVMTLMLNPPFNVPTIRNGLVSIEYSIKVKFRISLSNSVSKTIPIDMVIPVESATPVPQATLEDMKPVQTFDGPTAPSLSYC